MDIDNFKNINDTYGHSSGDIALIEAGTILQNSFSISDSIVARYGGDEFAAIVHNCDESKANSILNTINATLSEFNNNRFNLSISAGFAKRSESESIKELIASADKMMYSIKKEKKGA